MKKNLGTCMRERVYMVIVACVNRYTFSKYYILYVNTHGSHTFIIWYFYFRLLNNVFLG